MTSKFINIPTSVPTTCSLQCNFFYDHKNSATTSFFQDPSSAHSYFTMTYDGPGSNIVYNHTTYTIDPTNSISMYKGGIHTFNRERPEVEMVIQYNSSNGILYVCIPISPSESMTQNTPFDIIIHGFYTDKTSDSMQLNNFNLNDVIPKSTFFIHSGPYLTTANSSYIVFPNGSYSLAASTLEMLVGVDHPTEANICHTPFDSNTLQVNTSSLVQNIKGTTINGFSNDGQIYIDCQPTDSEGEIVVKETIVPTNFYKFNMSSLIYFVIVVISCILLVVLYQKIGDMFTVKKTIP